MPVLRGRYRWWLIGTAICALCVVTALVLVKGGGFERYLRAHVSAELAGVAGGPVRIDKCDLDWAGATLTCSDLQARNFRARSLAVQFSLRSLLDRRIDLANVVVDRPEVDLSVPGEAAFSPGPVFALHAARYTIRNAVVRFTGHEQRFSIRGEDLNAQLKRIGTATAYTYDVQTRHVDFATDCCGNDLAVFEAQGTLHPDSLVVTHARVETNTDRIDVSGAIDHFSDVHATFRYRLESSAAEMARRFGFAQIQQGKLAAEGKVEYRSHYGWTSSGHMRAANVSYRGPKAALTGAAMKSDYAWDGHRLQLSHSILQLLGGNFRGTATVTPDRIMSFSGRIDHANVQELARMAGWRALPWPALAAGAVAGASKKGLLADLAITSSRASGISGHIAFAVSRSKSLTFSESEVTLPHTNVTFHGSEIGGFAVNATSTDLSDLTQALTYLQNGPPAQEIPTLLPGGTASFSGTVRVSGPELSGKLVMTHLRADGLDWDRLSWSGQANSSQLFAQSFELTSRAMHASGSGSVDLDRWRINHGSGIDAQITAAISDWSILPHRLPFPISGKTAVKLNIAGTLNEPRGNASIALKDGRIYGEPLESARAELEFAGSDIRIAKGSAVDATGDRLTFAGSYLGSHSTLQGHLETDRFVLSHLNAFRGLDGVLSGSANFAAELNEKRVRPLRIDGNFRLRKVSVDAQPLGNAEAHFKTQAQNLQIAIEGDLRGNPFSGAAAIGLDESNPISGNLRFARIEGSDFLPAAWPIDGFVSGEVHFHGKLDQIADLDVQADLGKMELRPKRYSFVLQNTSPVRVEFAKGAVRLQRFELAGPDTQLMLGGEVSAQAVDLNVDGSLGIQVVQLADPDIETASGQSTIHAAIRGTLHKPLVSGTFVISNGAIALRDVSNGLNHIDGSIRFDQDRATINTLSADAGGGHLALGGFVTFGGKAPLAYHLEAHAQATRLRYANGISLTTDANLRLTGTSTNSLLSGNAVISRVVFNPSTDVGNVLTSVAALAPIPANQKAFVSGLQLDVAIESAPNLQISTALSRDVEAVVDLRLRGTPEHPVLLGIVSANQGDIRVFGGRYTINRGEVSFQNTSRIEPVLDLDLQTQARGINVDLTISGTLSHLNIAYRSDPPLEPRDIIALLTVGRTPQEAANVQTTQIPPETSALQSSANSVLGQAIAPPSGRLSRLFGITNIKIDPLVQGITNTPQSRLTLEQQISRSITVTYITNLEQTSEQIFRLEWAINRQYSLVAVRDDNGEFGIDIQYKKRFK